MSGGGNLSLTDVAKWAEVRLSAVSNWRTRHSDFPMPHVVSGQEMFDAQEVAEWLRGRRIPRNRLKQDERPGTSYGDRFHRNLDTLGAPTTTAEDHDTQPSRSSWEKQLWSAAEVLRHAHDRASSLEILLGLVYVRKHRAEAWQSLIAASTLTELRDRLAGIELPTGTGVQPVPVFRAVGSAADSSLSRAIEIIDKFDLSAGDAAAHIGEIVLANLERGLGRSGGHFTPPDVARCLVELLDPRPSDEVYDPFCGSGELLVAAAKRIGRQSGSLDSVHFFGQTPHEWPWRTSTMNLALHGVQADLSTPANALKEDRFPERRFSRILANPPFGHALDLPSDRVWPFGEPPTRYTDFAWLQHVVTKLKPDGRAAVVMPSGAAWRQSPQEISIRGRMVDAGVVEAVIEFPTGLFRFTSIPVMVWVLRSVDATPAPTETLLIDARDLGETIDRTKRALRAADIDRVVSEYRRWSGSQSAGAFTSENGFSHAVGHDELRDNHYDLSPSRYIAASEADDAGPTTQFLALRDKLDALRERALTADTTVDARLAALTVKVQPSGDGQSVPLGTVCDVLPGPGTVRRSGHEPSWTPLVLPRNIWNNRVGRQNLDVVPPATARRLARYRLSPGDIVTARTGTLGRFGRVVDEQTGWLLGPGCVRFRPNDQADPDYLTYYLGTSSAREWLMDHASGSVIRHVTATTLREMPLWLPPLHLQRAIVEILDSAHTAASIHDQIGAATKGLHDLVIAMTSPSEEQVRRRG